MKKFEIKKSALNLHVLLCGFKALLVNIGMWDFS